MTSLAGPVFDKELRVASRRKRFYALRFIYLAALTFFVAMTWIKWVETARSWFPVMQGWPVAAQRAQISTVMAAAGTHIVDTILWFQFIATQIVAVFLCSTAVNEEVSRRTLGILLTTPVSCFKIVLGKLLSKLLQVVILLAISLPLLAIVRIFGGVPWGMVVSGLLITLAGAVMVGSLSLYLSSVFRDAPRVVLFTALFYGAAFCMLPLCCLIADPAFSSFSPPFAMWLNSAGLMDPSAGTKMAFLCPFFCVLMILFAAVLMKLATVRVRRAALRSAAGPGPQKVMVLYAPGYQPPTRRVSGSAMIWKELRFYLPANKRKMYLAFLLAGAMVMLSYASCAASRMLDYVSVQMLYIIIWLGLSALLTALMAATSITVEKESRALVLLLTAPMSDASIILAKASGVLRRAAPTLVMLAVHLAGMAALGAMHWAGAVLVALLSAWVIVFLGGMGMYFSSLLRTSSAAVVATVGACLGLWVAAPAFATALPGQWRAARTFLQTCNPGVQLSVIVQATSELHAREEAGRLEFQWPHSQEYDIRELTSVARSEAPSALDSSLAGAMGVLALSCLGYGGLGVLMAWRAKVLMRRRLFG
ncbi:MAG: ABC transporter permease [Phycisphaerae bacterium]